MLNYFAQKVRDGNTQTITKRGFAFHCAPKRSVDSVTKRLRYSKKASQVFFQCRRRNRTDMLRVDVTVPADEEGYRQTQNSAI
jgi:hypothetical protein